MLPLIAETLCVPASEVKRFRDIASCGCVRYFFATSLRNA